jgi:hypothetical protein
MINWPVYGHLTAACSDSGRPPPGRPEVNHTMLAELKILKLRSITHTVLHVHLRSTWRESHEPKHVAIHRVLIGQLIKIQVLYVWRNTAARSCNHNSRGKAISITYVECVYSLSYPTWALSYCRMWLLRLHLVFQHYLINGMILGGKIIEHKKCVLIFSTNFVGNMSHSEKNSVRYYHKCSLYMSSRKVSVILARLQWNLNLLDGFPKNL